MLKEVLRNELGEIVFTGDLGEHTLIDGWTLTKEDSDLIQGKWVAKSDYISRRVYPEIGDQLDYIYHNGIEAWKTDLILSVKEANPKVK